MTVFEEVKTGLEEAIKYEKERLQKCGINFSNHSDKGSSQNK